MSIRLIRYLATCILLVSLISLIPLKNLKLDASYQSFFSDADKEVQFFEEFRNQFNTRADEEFIFIGLENQSGIFEQGFLRKTGQLTQYIEGLENIRKVYSVTNANLISFSNNQVNARPLINIENPESFRADSLYLFNAEEYRKLLVSQNGKAIAVAAFNKEDLNPREKKRLVTGIQKKLDSLGFYKFHFISKIGLEEKTASSIKRELKSFALFFFIALFLFSMIIYRGTGPALFITVTLIVSCLWIGAIMSMLNHAVQPLIPFIILELAVSSIINFFLLAANSENNNRLAYSKPKRARSFFKNYFLLSGIFVILALMFAFSSVPSVKHFGIFSAIGLIINPVIAVVIFPLFISIPTGKKNIVAADTNKLFNAPFDFSRRQMVVPVGISLLLLMAFLPVASKFSVNAKISNQLPATPAIRDSYRFMEETFSGLRPFEMVITVRASQQSFFDVDVMKKVEEIKTYLEDSCKVGSLISPLSLFKAANKAFNGGEILFYQLPEQKNVVQFYETIMQTEHADELQQYLTLDGKGIRISGRTPDLSRSEADKLAEKIEGFFNLHRFGNLLSYKITGPAVVINNALIPVNRNLISFFATGIFLLLLLTLYFLRSVKAIAYCAIFAVLPLLFVVAAVSVLDLSVGFEAAPLFLIAFIVTAGIVFQYIIHFRTLICQGPVMNGKKDHEVVLRHLAPFSGVLLLLFLPLTVSAFGIISNIGILLSLLLIMFFFLFSLFTVFESRLEATSSVEK